MHRPSIPARALFTLLLPVILAACGDDPTPPVAEDVETASDGEEDVKKQVTQGNFYQITLVFPSGVQQVYTRNLDEAPGAFAFGSTHIGTAVSLAINDVLYDPFASIAFNFGFVVGSNDYPVTITDTGKWAWGNGSTNAPPGLKIETKDAGIPRKFVSWLEGAEGSYTMTKWGTNSGDRVAGTITGTLVNDGPDPVTAYLEGEFQFFLPEKAGGQ